MTGAFTFDGTCIHLRPKSAASMLGGAAFWAGIAVRRDLGEGRLMGSTSQGAHDASP